MTPESRYVLTKAKELLGEAKAVLGIGLDAAAGRTASLACLHAARALIPERTGPSPKTHRGAHRLFYELTTDDPKVDAELRAAVERHLRSSVGRCGRLASAYIDMQVESQISLVPWPTGVIADARQAAWIRSATARGTWTRQRLAHSPPPATLLGSAHRKIKAEEDNPTSQSATDIVGREMGRPHTLCSF